MTEELIRIKWGVFERYLYPFGSLFSLFKADCGSNVYRGFSLSYYYFRNTV